MKMERKSGELGMLFAMHKHRSVIDSKTNKRVEFLLKGLCFRHEVVVKQEIQRFADVYSKDLWP